MSEMNTKQMMEYLKHVADLETSVYMQTEVRAKAQDELVMRNVEKEDIPEPERVAIDAPYEPSYWRSLCAVYSENPFLRYSYSLFVMFFKYPKTSQIVLWSFMIFFAIIEAPMVILWTLVLVLGYALVGLIFAPIFAIFHFNEWKKYYNEEYELYQKNDQKADSEYKLALENFQKGRKKAEENYQAECELAKINFEKAQAGVLQLDAPLQETKALLERLYDQDVIFAKYRNMIAVCTMYEYFASGRCTELTGANGAYNLYEAELRQNIIINQLEMVNTNLEQVKQNQYIVYQGVMQTNQALQTITTDVKRIVSATEDIAVSSQITAYCSKITAANAMAQTYMALTD